MRKVIAALLACASLLTAQISADQRRAILAYQLTSKRADQLIAALGAMNKYVVAMPDYQDRAQKMYRMSPGDRIEQMEKDTKAMAILKQNGLTAAEYMTGVPALRMAVSAAEGGQSGGPMIASQANVAFARVHLTDLKKKLDAADAVLKK